MGDLTFNSTSFGKCYVRKMTSLDEINSISSQIEIGKFLDDLSVRLKVDLSNPILSETDTQILQQSLRGIFPMMGETAVSLIMNYFGRDCYFYKITTNNGLLLGVAYYYNSELPEVGCYILPPYIKDKIAAAVIETLTDSVFEKSRHKLVTTYIIEDEETHPAFNIKTDLEKFGFSKSTEKLKYEVSRVTRGICQLSSIIREKPLEFIPKTCDLTRGNMLRATLLWYYHFDHGFPLANGGVEFSLISKEKVLNNTNLQSFQGYRSDRREESVAVSQDQIKQFLAEEGLIPSCINYDELTVSFCLGNHEGTMRVARCIYKDKLNDGIFYVIGSYGLLASSMGVMKPVAFAVNTIQIDTKNGEKMLFQDLKEQIKNHPTTKTILIELKTVAGATYSEKEVAELITICKKDQIFILFDLAHHNMEFSEKGKFPDILSLCKEQNFHEYAMIYTGSKTYGLERARMGWIYRGCRQI